LTPEDFRKLGLNRQKARAIIELSIAVVKDRLHLESLEGLNDEQVVERLCELRGVGRWTAEYVLLRGLGRLHIFPGDDVGARNQLQRWLRLRKPLDYQGVRRVLAPWQSHAGLIYFHLLMNRLDEKGYLK
jgi:DNA-3-methyladenine glycosylase II